MKRGKYLTLNKEKKQTTHQLMQLISLSIKQYHEQQIYNIFYTYIKFISRMQSHVQHIRTQDSYGKANLGQMPSSAQLYKVIKNLQKIANQQKQKRQSAQQQLLDFKHRSIRRERELSDLIRKLNQSKSKTLQQNSQINKLIATIWMNFDQFNKKSLQIIAKSYEDNLESLSRKIKSIISVMNEELESKQKKSTINLELIMNDVRHLCNAAINIQERNTQMAIQIKKLQFQVQLLKEEKQLAIQDAIDRKIKLAALAQQNKKLNETMQKSRVTTSKKQNSKTNMDSQRLELKMQDQEFRCNPQIKRSNSKNNDYTSQIRKLQKNKSESYSFETVLQNHKLRMETIQNHKDKKQAFFNSTISFNGTNKIYPQAAQTPLLTTKKIQGKLQLKKFNRSFMSKRHSEESNDCLRSSKKGQAKLLMTPMPQSKQKQAKLRQYHYIRTIQNLKQCLKRQKNKSLSIGSVVTKISNQNKQINEALQQILKEVQKSPNKLEQIQRSEKLLKTLQVLKQRLNAIQTPLVNIGWGNSLSNIQ